MAKSFSGTASGSSGENRGLFLGTCDSTLRVRKLIERASRVDATVLIVGESGSGKELVAREIHARSDRRSHPFVALNCAAIPESLIEAELFGHEAGAYTDAREPRRGAFELAHRGTLFLDEVGDLSLTAQPKLLRVLESRELQRIGGEKRVEVDLRILAATNHDLKAMCRQKRFRADLYFRLRVLKIRVPPLRERLADVPLLVDHFVSLLAAKTGREVGQTSPEVVASLQRYHWPGNVRELRSVVESALAMSSGHRLDPSCFEVDPVSMPGQSFGNLLELPWRSARERFEAAYAKRLLTKHRGNVQEAARDAGLATGSFYKMLRRLGLRPDQSSPDPKP